VVLVLLARRVGCDLHVDVGRVQEALEGRGARGDGVDGGVGFGRNAVELVRPGEWTSAPVESRMMEEERSGVLGVLVED
jgi:hypothetical protein